MRRLSQAARLDLSSCQHAIGCCWPSQLDTKATVLMRQLKATIMCSHDEIIQHEAQSQYVR